MDRQVSKINKSDGRDRLFKAFCQGKEAFCKRPEWWNKKNPYSQGTVWWREWESGWAEAKERRMIQLGKLFRRLAGKDE